MKSCLPDWLDPGPWIAKARSADPSAVLRALAADSPGENEFAALLAPVGADLLERMARRAQNLTHRHFGKTISLYVPLYLSNYCPGGCAYCGFASDRDQPRRRLGKNEILGEMRALKAKNFEDVLLLTGERCPEADFDYLVEAVSLGARLFHNVTVESFAMTSAPAAPASRSTRKPMIRFFTKNSTAGVPSATTRFGWRRPRARWRPECERRASARCSDSGTRSRTSSAFTATPCACAGGSGGAASWFPFRVYVARRAVIGPRTW
jgi:hypothetical protein